MPVAHTKRVAEAIERVREKMRRWGIAVSFLASRPVFRGSTFGSRQMHMQTFGDRLRAARVSAGLTLKQVAVMIGYTWVGVERWEKNMCLPKPGVLWHLRSLYGVDENWIAPESRVLQRERAA